jgi:hypothetical protein
MKATGLVRLLQAVMLFAVATSVEADNYGSEVASLLSYTRGASAAAGIGELGETQLPEGQQEIRIWIGFGVLATDRMLRLQVNPSGEVRGEVLVHYENDNEMSAEELAEFRRDWLAGCSNLREGSEETVCTATFDHEPDWQAIHQDLLKVGLFELPDESTLPTRTHVKDGVSLVVELRNGSGYRAYQYSNPSLSSEPQAISANKIMKVVNQVIVDSNTVR